jgi:hypothetical protein
MDRSLFLLAQFGPKIELAQVSDTPMMKVGEKFDRMPGKNIELWTVIKVFDREEHDRMVALITLMGIDAVGDLFEIELDCSPESLGLMIGKTVTREARSA